MAPFVSRATVKIPYLVAARILPPLIPPRRIWLWGFVPSSPPLGRPLHIPLSGPLPRSSGGAWWRRSRSGLLGFTEAPPPPSQRRPGAPASLLHRAGGAAVCAMVSWASPGRCFFSRTASSPQAGCISSSPSRKQGEISRFMDSTGPDFSVLCVLATDLCSLGPIRILHGDLDG